MFFHLSRRRASAHYFLELYFIARGIIMQVLFLKGSKLHALFICDVIAGQARNDKG